MIYSVTYSFLLFEYPPNLTGAFISRLDLAETLIT